MKSGGTLTSNLATGERRCGAGKWANTRGLHWLIVGAALLGLMLAAWQSAQAKQAYSRAASAAMPPTNTPPTINVGGVTRAAGSVFGFGTLAYVNDAEDAEDTLQVTVNHAASATTSGVTVTIQEVTSGGQVRGHVTTACSSSTTNFLLRVTDSGGAAMQVVLTVTVTPNTPPTLTYNNPPTLDLNDDLLFDAASGPLDNGAVTNIVVHSVPPAFNGYVKVNQQGLISINDAAPAGSYNVTIRATDQCGAVRDATFTFTVNYGAGCQFTLSPPPRSFPAAGGHGMATLTTPSNCGWTLLSSAPWLTITSNTTGFGTATVTYFVAQNTDEARRQASITVGNQAHTVYQGRDFLDVPVGHLFYNFIGKLSAHGITNGCGNGNYCPDAGVTRDQMAAFIIRALHEPGYVPSTPMQQRFLDVPLTHPFAGHIEELAQRQVTLGCGGGNYCPASNVTREQMAAFIIRALHPAGYVPPAPTQQRFLDVPPPNPFYAHIEEMAVRQITLGCSDSLYCPTAHVTRGQMAAFLVRAFGL